MKTFLRQNPTIAFGLGLPLLLVVTFLVISGVPALIVAPPQYDVLYATEYYNHQNAVQISVSNQSVKVVYHPGVQNQRKPRFWRYNPTTGAVKEISFVLPPSPTPSDQPPATNERSESIEIEIHDFDGVTVESSSIAPDGYEFSVANRSSNNLFGGLFYSSRYRHEAVLTKNGRSIRLPNAVGRYYQASTHFIGWVVSP